jgi:hypothetical protein
MKIKITQILSWFLIAFALIGLATQLVPALMDYYEQSKIAITYPYSIDYGEGPLLDQTLRVAKLENIYRNTFSSAPYTISNYPPLFLLLQAPFTRVFGPAFWYGRSISIVSILLTALLMSLTLRALTRDWIGPVVAGLLLIAFPYVQHWSMFNRIDELALVFSWAALFVTVKYLGCSFFASGEKAGPLDLTKNVLRTRSLWLAALLFVASIYSRQTYALAAPFAAFVWLIFGSEGSWGQRIARALLLGITVGGITLGLFFIINQATAGGFYLNIIVANVNAFYWNTVSHYVHEILDRLWPLLALSGLFFLAEAITAIVKWFVKRSQKSGPASASLPLDTEAILGQLVEPEKSSVWALVLPYLLASAAGSITIGKDGSNVNYLLELCAALSLAGGAALAWGAQWKRWYARSAAQIAVIALLAVQSFIMVDWTRSDFKPQITGLAANQDRIAAVEKIIQETPGIVLADEYMGLVPLAGKQLYLQPFEYKQMADAKIWDETPFLTDVSNHKFDLIVWYQPATWEAIKARYTTAQIYTIKSDYELDTVIGDVYLYRPKK